MTLIGIPARKSDLVDQQEPFDYTKWGQGLFEDASVEKISQKAMELRNKRVKEVDRAEFQKTLDEVPARKPLPGNEFEYSPVRRYR